MNRLLRTLHELYEGKFTNYQVIHIAYNEGVISKTERDALISEFL